MRSVANAAAWRDRLALESASMIGAASSGVSFPSATSRRIVSSSSGIGVLPGEALRRLIDVDLAALERLEHLELLRLAEPAPRWAGRRRRGRRGDRGRWARRHGRNDPAAAPRAADDDVAGHRAEEEARVTIADHEAAPVARALRAMGERDADVGREAAHLERQPAGGGEEEVAAHRLDAVLRAGSEEAL